MRAWMTVNEHILKANKVSINDNNAYPFLKAPPIHMLEVYLTVFCRPNLRKVNKKDSKFKRMRQLQAS